MNPAAELSQDSIGRTNPSPVHPRTEQRTTPVSGVRRAATAAPLTALEGTPRAAEPTSTPKLETELSAYTQEAHALARTSSAFFAVLSATVLHYGATTQPSWSGYTVIGLLALACAAGIHLYSTRAARSSVDR